MHAAFTSVYGRYPVKKDWSDLDQRLWRCGCSLWGGEQGCLGTSKAFFVFITSVLTYQHKLRDAKCSTSDFQHSNMHSFPQSSQFVFSSSVNALRMVAALLGHR